MIWFTGLPSSGKTILSNMVFRAVLDAGFDAEMLEEQNVLRESGLVRTRNAEVARTSDLGIAHLAKLLARHGVVVVVDAIAPYESVRRLIRERIGEYVEVYCPCASDGAMHPRCHTIEGQQSGTAEEEDPSVSTVYEEPQDPEIVVQTGEGAPEENARKIVEWLADNGYFEMMLRERASDENDRQIVEKKLRDLGYL